MLPAICALALTALPLLAQSAQRPIPVAAELIQGWVRSDGTRISGLRLTLAPGWKTYWRAPGDAGIPPQFDWRRSRNLAGVAVGWPTPQVFDQGGMQAIGYTREVILPLTLQPKSSGPVALDVTVDMGVCSDICVPQQLRVRGQIDTDSTAPTPSIVAALSEQPLTGREAGLRAARCRLSPTDKGIEITAMLDLPPQGGTETVVIEAGHPGIWVSPTDATRQAGRLTAQADMLSSDPALLAIDRSDIRITVLGRNGAVDIRGCDAG